MSAGTASAGPGEMACPDPSVHERHNRLSEQASSAALYVTHPERQSESRDSNSRESPLGPDGKLSSKGAAASLKYAKAHELPSFPSHGLPQADSAGKAAMKAKDYKMQELWQPELSQAGSRAALIAHGKGAKLDLWQASATPEGHSAATMAMRNKGLSPNVDYGVTPDGKSKALRAATMSHHSGRQRAESTPQPIAPAYPDSHNSGTNALNAATAVHRASTIKSQPDGWDSEANQAARIKNLGDHMDRHLFTGSPNVDIDPDETKHQHALRASAASMAKTIYETQNRTALTDDPNHIAGAQAAANRSSTSTAPDLKQEAMRYIHLQEAAHKLAAERLAKVDKNFEAARYREYYGYGDKPKRLSSNMSLRSKAGRGRARNRASSDTAAADFSDSDDEEQARRIRTQMSALQGGLSDVDEKKQQADRANLLAAAEKRVSARMHKMDENVYHDTGKIPPSLMQEWEDRARERQQKERELAAENPGKTHIGGGKFMDQSEIEAIAAARLKPTLDEITDTAEKKRARDAELAAEKEEQERIKREDKAQKTAEKEEQKRVKNEEKAAAAKEKAEEKARRDEEKRMSKDDKRKSRDQKRDDTGVLAAGALGAGAGVAAAGGAAAAEGGEASGDAAAEGVQRHRSALSRLKERFRRSQAPGEERPEEDFVEEEQDRPSAGATVATGAAGGAITGATIDEAASKPTPAKPEELDQQQAAHAVAQEETDRPVTAVKDTTADPVITPPVALGAGAAATAAAIAVNVEDADVDEPTSAVSKPQRPAFEQKPSLAGYHNDEDGLRPKPNLERHISHIPESDDDDDGDDDDDSDDEDWNDERIARPVSLGVGKAQIVADRVGTAPVTDKPVDPPIPTNDRTDETLAQLDDQRAEPPRNLPSTLESPGVPKATPAALTDLPVPTATTEPAVSANTATTEPAEPATTTKAENPAEDLEKTPTKTQQAAAFAIGVATAGTADVDASKIGTKQERSSTSEAPTRTTTNASSNEKSGKEKKGFRSLLGRLSSKSSKSQQFAPGALKPMDSSKYDTTKTAEAPTTGTNGVKKDLPAVDTAVKTSDHVGTDGVIGDKERVSGIAGNPVPESPSSFRRHEATAPDLDDVSSSGNDEDDVVRGRGGGRSGRKLGKNSKATNGNVDIADADDRHNSTTEDEQFEEARDHFDETLAPPPAFAGQAKSESPVRETKFQEQL